MRSEYDGMTLGSSLGLLEALLDKLSHVGIFTIGEVERSKRLLRLILRLLM